MDSVRDVVSKFSIPLAIISLALLPVRVSRASEKTNLTGHWNFNAEQSDDAREKIHDAQQNTGNSRRDAGRPGGTYPGGGPYPGGGYPGGGYPGGGVGVGAGGAGWPIGGPMGHPGHGGMPRGEESSQVWDRLAANPNFLNIEQHEERVVVTDDSDHTRNLYPDGKKHEDKDANGKKTSTKSDWKGDALVTESKLGHSGKLTETYRVTSDGKQLYVVSEFEDSSLAGPVSIRRVFDLRNASAAK